MKKPQTLTILGSKYKVTYHKDWIEYNGVACAGLCSASRKEIQVSEQADIPATLLHEIVHAVVHEAALDQTSVHPDIVEIFCEQIAKAISGNFKITAR